MDESHRSKHQLLSSSVFLILLFLLTHKFPAEPIDPAAVDLTALVNTLMNSSLSGSHQLFSLLSVTSYSALDLHKLTLLVYNISSVTTFSSSWFRRRFCYCVTNHTNDLTDFTAILLDVMGNSTNYVHELFKSASIVSVSQRNQSTCIYICVMAGRAGAEVSQLWELHSITPIFNQTIMEGPPPVSETQQPTERSHISGLSSALNGRVQPAAAAETATLATNATQLLLLPRQPRPEEPTRGPVAYPAPELETQPATEEPTFQQPATFQEPRSQQPAAVTAARWQLGTATEPNTAVKLGVATQQTTIATLPATMAKKTPLPSTHLQKPGCRWSPSDWTGDPAAVGMTTISSLGLQPCVLQLCSFFSRCLCGRVHHKAHLKRFCVDGHNWYQKHTSEVCRRVRRISFSRNLKQRCLIKMCEKP